MNAALIAGMGLTLSCAYFLVRALRHFQTAQESEGWPTTQGKMTEVQLWGKRLVDGTHQDADRLSVKYEYAVQGWPYTSTRVAFFTLMYPETYRFAQENPAHGDTTIHYNPKQPAEAVLIPGPRKDKPYSDIILSALGMMIGVALTTLAWTGAIG